MCILSWKDEGYIMDSKSHYWLMGLIAGLFFCVSTLTGSSIPVSFAADSQVSGTYTITAVTQFSCDFAVSVKDAADANYFAVYRYDTIIGSVTTITDKVRSIPQMFSDPGLLEVRFYSDAVGSNLTARASLNASHQLVFQTADNCFIATAAFGSKFEPTVILLRQFRDKCLLSNLPGQLFVDFYYRYSPSVADFIASSSLLKGVVRILLIPLIGVAYLCLHPVWFLVLLFPAIMGRFLFVRMKNKAVGLISLIVFFMLVVFIVPSAIAATIHDIDDNSLRIGNDVYSLSSNNLTNENIINSLLKSNQVYFKIGGHWYDVFAAESDAALGVPANALNSNMVAGWTGLDKWYKAGSEIATITSITLLTAPLNLTATATGNTQINLAWNAVTGAASYNIYRSSAQAGPYTKINNSYNNRFNDTNLAVSTAYWYRVTAVNSAGEGAFSASTSATTLAGFNTYLNNARTYYSNEQYDQAISECNQALLLNMNNAEVYVIRGASYLWLNQYPSALNDFNSALTIDPNNAMAYSGKGWYYLYTEQFTDAITHFNTAISLDSALTLSYKGRGLCYAFSGQPNSALQDFSSFIQHDPNNADAYFLRAATYFELDNNQSCIADYNQAILLNPQDGYAYNNRGAAYYMMGETQTAINDYNRATQLVSNYFFAYNNLGVAYSDLGQYQNAVNAYNTAVSMEPQYALAYSNRGEAYAYLKQYQNALSSWAQAIAIDNELEPAYNCRGWYYCNSNQYSLAVADFTTALQLSANNSEDNSFNPWRSIHYQVGSGRAGAFNGRGWSNYYLNMYNNAISDFTNCLSINPYYANAYDGRGWSYYMLGNYTEAVSNFTNCIALAPNNIDALDGRGCSYYWLYQYANALSDFNKCITLDPYNDYFYDWRGWTYLGLQMYINAEADFRYCLGLNPNNTSAKQGLAELGYSSYSVQSTEDTPVEYPIANKKSDPTHAISVPTPKALFESTPVLEL